MYQSSSEFLRGDLWQTKWCFGNFKEYTTTHLKTNCLVRLCSGAHRQWYCGCSTCTNAYCSCLFHNMIILFRLKCMYPSVCGPCRNQWSTITLRSFSRELQLCLCSGSLSLGGAGWTGGTVLQPHRRAQGPAWSLWVEGERVLGGWGATSVCLEGINR